MASGGSDRNAEDALSKLLQRGTVVEYHNEFEMLINRVTGIYEGSLKALYISELKPALQCALLRSNPTTLGEAFFRARITDARFEDENNQEADNNVGDQEDPNVNDKQEVKKVKKLPMKLQSKKNFKEALETTSKDLKKKMLDHDLQKIAVDQKKKHYKTKRTLKIDDEEFKKAKSEATTKIRKLAKVYGAWLPPWLAAHFVVYQPYVKNHWKEFMIIQRRIWKPRIKTGGLHGSRCVYISPPPYPALAGLGIVVVVVVVHWPKDKGGLGLKDLQRWNETLLLKHLWNIASKKDTLWVKWINTERLKGKNLWDVQFGSNSSPLWKTLFGVRSIVRERMWYKISDGKKISVWYDKWNSLSPLCNIVTKRDIYAAKMTDDCTLADAVESGNLKWPIEWYRSESDMGFYGLVYTMYTKACICSMDGCPREAANSRQNIEMEVLKCALCDEINDSHDHMFSKCKYSAEIWRNMQQLLIKESSQDWKEIIKEMSQLKNSKNIWCIVRKLLMSLKVKETKAVQSVDIKWNVEMQRSMKIAARI
ncbi:hypothetical protein Tco_0591585 [Tanacetum coccineum]